MSNFLNQVHILQWDDHRYYHQSRINQTLHFISALSFLVAYVFLFVDPAISGLIGWGLGMVIRQSGHIFFEPRAFDEINGVSDVHKEAIKVGFNMQRKAILIGVWLSLPLTLWFSPSLFGWIEPATNLTGFWHDTGISWLALAVAGIGFRTVHLFFLRNPLVGLAWATKILLDPIHNVAIYWRSPFALLKGEMLDPIH